MKEYQLSKKALDDLSEIWDYTYDEWSEEQADKYYFELLTMCQNLADNSVLGKFYKEIHSDLQGFPSGKHIIFYRKMNEFKIEIIRILWQGMDVNSKINN